MKYKHIFTTIIAIISTILSFNCKGNDHPFFLKKEKKDCLYDIVSQVPKLEEHYDKVALIIIPPGRCPRCEGMINSINKNFESVFPEIPVMLTFSHPNKNVARKYAKYRNYDADIKTFNTGSLLECFYYYPKPLPFPYLIMFDLNNLYITYIEPLVGRDINEKWVRKMVNESLSSDEIFLDEESYRENFDKLKKAVKSNNFINNYINSVSIVNENSFKLESDHEFPLGTPVYIDYNPEYNMLVVTDNTFPQNLVYDTNNGSLLDNIRVTEEKKNLLIDLPDKYINIINSLNISRGLMFRPKIFSDSSIKLFGILPSYTMVNDQEIEYRNKHVILKNNITEGKTEVVKAFDPDERNSGYSDRRYVFGGGKFLEESQSLSFVVPFFIGWPTINVTDFNFNENIDNERDNPLIKAFYEDDKPLAGGFDKSYELLQEYGQLSKISKLARTGYSFEDFLAIVDNNNLIVGSQYTGEVAFFNKESGEKQKSVSLWENDLIPYYQKVDSSFLWENTYLYHDILEKTLFQKKIKDMTKMKDETIVFLTQENQKLYIVTCHDNEEIYYHELPDKLSENVKHVGIESYRSDVFIWILENIQDEFTFNISKIKLN